jgi:hypothetical protein
LSNTEESRYLAKSRLIAHKWQDAAKAASWATASAFKSKNLIPDMAGVTIKENLDPTRDSKLDQPTHTEGGDQNRLVLDLIVMINAS